MLAGNRRIAARSAVQRKESERMAETTGVFLPHKIIRAYLGVWALAWDALVENTQEPETLFARGRTLEASIAGHSRALWKNVERTPASLVAAVRGVVRTPLLRVEKDLAATSAIAEEELERQIDHALARLGIPTRERILELGRDIDALTARIDRELDRLVAESVYSV